jgi:hypothetical protein
LAAFEARWEQRVHGTTKMVPLARFATERPALPPLPPQPFLGCHEEFRHVSNDCLIFFQGVRYSVPWPYAGKQVLVRQSVGRTLVVLGQDGQELVRHLLQLSGTAPVLVPAHYEGLRRRHQAAWAGLTRNFRTQFGSHGVAETFLQRLLAQHRHHSDRALEQVLELLSGVAEAEALRALAAAVECNLCGASFLAECLRRETVAGGGAERAQELPLPALGTQLTLPNLEVERPLHESGRALTPAASGAAGAGLEPQIDRRRKEGC